MNTEPEFSQRSHRASDQCPRCGRDKPWQQTSYWNPQTGEQKSFADLPSGCLIWIVAYIVAYFAIGIVVELGVGILLYLTGHMNDPLYADVGMIAIPIACTGAFFAMPAIGVYREWRQQRLRKTRITITYFVCNSCKNQWTVTQQPTAKKLS